MLFYMQTKVKAIWKLTVSIRGHAEAGYGSVVRKQVFNKVVQVCFLYPRAIPGLA